MRPSRFVARCALLKRDRGAARGPRLRHRRLLAPQLAALPIDTIKVDRRFVAALGTEDATGPIAQAVIATGSALGLSVIGAGAETREQVEELRTLGCTDVQGFFSPSRVRDEISALLAAGGELKRTVK